MKQLLLLFFICQAAIAQQDSTKKQRFVDEHQYFFMTKEPSKSLLKIYANSNNTGASLYPYFLGDLTQGLYASSSTPEIAYERKIKKAFSIEVGGYGGYGQLVGFIGSFYIEPRYYLGMNKRILEDKSGDNLSGTYIGLQARTNQRNRNKYYILSGNPSTSDYTFESPVQGASSFTFKIGNQQRMANKKFIDVSLNLGLIKYRAIANDGKTIEKVGDITKFDNFYPSLNTQVKFGFWLNKLKNKSDQGKCEFLRCFVEEKQLLKINLNNAFQFSKYSKSISLDADFEQKIASSPLSLNLRLKTGISNNIFRITSKIVDCPGGFPSVPNGLADCSGIFRFSSSKLAMASIHIQPRYYFLQRNQIIKGKAVNNLSGFYIAPSLGFAVYQLDFNSVYSTVQKEYKLKGVVKNTSLGGGMGWQARFSKKAFVDAGIGFTKLNPNYFGLNSSEPIFSVTSHNFTFKDQATSYLKIGYAIGR
jgi:hypothetical protein